jgi:two-component system chemotaxis response regulator CheB
MEAGRHPPGGAPSALTCPDCNGPLWELTEAGVTRYRCRIGHVFHEENLVAAKADEVETALWTAVETLDERADLLRRVADRMRRAGRPTGALVSAVEHAERQAEVIRGVLASGTAPEAA